MNTPGYVAAVVAKAEAGGIHGAEMATLRRRLRQLGEQDAGLLPSEVLEPLANLPRLDELPEPSPGQARDVLDRLVIVKLPGSLAEGAVLLREPDRAGPAAGLSAGPRAQDLRR
jgi:UTP--glucose-1-phosphate uridylyltransferase